MSKVHKKEIPESMGAICAVVYLLIIIVFIPFPFYKDIVAATSGGGNRDVVKEIDIVQTGRFLHRFPHSKVCPRSILKCLIPPIAHLTFSITQTISAIKLTRFIAGVLPFGDPLPPIRVYSWDWRRSFRYPLAA